MRPFAPPRLFSREVLRIHCIGVGGMGMAPLALYLSASGFTVTGEDDTLAPEVARLLAEGGVGICGLPQACDLAVHSSAIPAAHPSRAAARLRSVPQVRRGEMLAEAVRGRRLVAVCGSHGKTTTTAMLVTALRRSGVPAGYLLGGLFSDGTPPARTGSGEWVVAEIDESDGTIDGFAPEITLAVNLDWDHPDFYRRSEEFDAAFAGLFSRTRGTVLVSDACPRSLRVAEGSSAPAVATFGRSGDFSGFIAADTAERMALRLGGRFPAMEAQVRAKGEFNAANATAALAAAALMGAAPSPEALSDFSGVRRRQTVLSTAGGATVLEDYAHHPTEIRSLLGSLRRQAKEAARLIVVFQPHRFSRTAQFKAEFAAALALADRVHLLDVYPAGEAPIPGGTSADIYAELRRLNADLPVGYLPGGGGDSLRPLIAEVRSGDWVAFVGAGGIDQTARAWVRESEAAAERSLEWDRLAAELKAATGPGTKLRREEPLAARTTLRVGGSARLYAEPSGPDDLAALVRWVGERGIAVHLLGRGSNLIVPDCGVDGLVISLANPFFSSFEPREGGRVRAGAGLRLKNLCGLAAQAGLAGFEFLEGIPGTLGGALRMNAGAMGGWIFDVVESVEVMTLDGAVRTFGTAELHVGYRRCAELEGGIALSAVLRPAASGAADEIQRQIDVYRRKRHESQPREPSAGCIFKNPPGDSAGRLIELSGFKGERVGDAEVSAVHANFIVNRGRATSADVVELIRRVRARVRAAKGVELEPEVLLYGKAWEEVL